MAYNLYTVRGSIVLPGAKRDRIEFGPVRVSARNRQEASASVQPLIQVAFSKVKGQDGRPVQIGKAYALLNCEWSEYKDIPADKASEA